MTFSAVTRFTSSPARSDQAVRLPGSGVALRPCTTLYSAAHCESDMPVGCTTRVTPSRQVRRCDDRRPRRRKPTSDAPHSSPTSYGKLSTPGRAPLGKVRDPTGLSTLRFARAVSCEDGPLGIRRKRAVESSQFGGLLVGAVAASRYRALQWCRTRAGARRPDLPARRRTAPCMPSLSGSTRPSVGDGLALMR